MKERNRLASAQEGSAYVVVLLVLLLLTIFGLSLVLITHTERQIGANERDASHNFYAAESGIAVAIAWLQESNTQPHTITLGSRAVGGSGSSSSSLDAGQSVIRDRVQTTQLIVAGSQYSNLGDVSLNSGRQLKRANFQFETSSRRVLGSGSGPLAGKEVLLGQKRIELMVEMDLYDLGGDDAYTGPLDYATEESLAPQN